MTVKELIQHLQNCPQDYKWCESQIPYVGEKYLNFQDSIRERKGELPKTEKTEGVFLACLPYKERHRR